MVCLSDFETYYFIALRYIALGTHVDRRSHCLTIDSFEGKRNILDLEAYPVEYMRDKSLLQTMIGQGKKYMKFLQRNAPQCQYKGFVFTTQDGAKEMKERHFVSRSVTLSKCIAPAWIFRWPNVD